ncbi:MAG: NAD-dependent epimerase/dehydratase family protein [Planctomycetota bacterium]
MRIAVTGAFGYSGRYIAQRLLAAGHDVITFGRTRTAWGVITPAKWPVGWTGFLNIVPTDIQSTSAPCLQGLSHSPARDS